MNAVRHDGTSGHGHASIAVREEPARHEMMAVDDEDATLRPPASGRAEIVVLSGDGAFAIAAQRHLSQAGFTMVTARHVGALPAALPQDVLVIDPAEDRMRALATLEVLARVPSRPAVVIVVRDVRDLELATKFRVGCVAIDAIDDCFVAAVERARRDHRTPRLPHE